MLRIHLLGASAATSLSLFAGTAWAADIPSYPTPPPITQQAPTAPVTDWSGAYIGGLGGYGWGSGTVENKGWIGGGYLGANIQHGEHWVFGVEGDVTATGKNGASGGTTVENPWDATVRGRVGYAMGRVMLYGTGGVAAGRVEATTGGTTEADTKYGWTAGAGVEALLNDHVTGRLEYRHTDLGTASFSTNPPIDYTSNDVMVGIGLKF